LEVFTKAQNHNKSEMFLTFSTQAHKKQILGKNMKVLKAWIDQLHFTNLSSMAHLPSFLKDVEVGLNLLLIYTLEMLVGAL